MALDSDTNIVPGLYQHFKGGFYEVRSVAFLVDTDRQFVVYCRHGEEDTIYLREKSEFLQWIDRDGARIQRFQRIADSDNDQNRSFRLTESANAPTHSS